MISDCFMYCAYEVSKVVSDIHVSQVRIDKICKRRPKNCDVL